VYANLDVKEPPEVSWEDQYGRMDQQDVLVESGVDWSKVEYDFTWAKEGHFNWKLMQDNYNEVILSLLVHTHQFLTYLLVLPLLPNPPRRRGHHKPRDIPRRPRLTRLLHRPFLPAQRIPHLSVRQHSVYRPLSHLDIPRWPFLTESRHRLHAPHAHYTDRADYVQTRIRCISAEYACCYYRSSSKDGRFLSAGYR
jgi:hypothetical protein